MAELKIIPLKEREYLKKLIDVCTEKDIHVTPEYLTLFQEYQGYEAFYVYYGNEQNYVLIPYFKRPINIHHEQDKYFDIVSPWYYGGPIHNIKEINIRDKLFKEFLEKFSKYCQNNNIITEFQRFNPILKNYELYNSDSSLIYDRKTVYVDLTKDIKTLYKEYDRHARKNINKATRSELKVFSDDSKRGIKKFIEIYTESMKQKNARQFYYFNQNFFNNLFNIFKENIKLFHVEYKGEIICSSLELGNYHTLHDYLRGVNTNFLPLRPNDILIHEAITWAKSNGYNFFSMGGGNSSSEDDGIFRFKKSFSSTTGNFYVYKKVHNWKKYNELCILSGKNDIKYEKADYFPEYLSR